MEKIAHCIEEKEKLLGIQVTRDTLFSEMLLKDWVHKGLHKAGFVYPTEFQSKAIPLGKAGIDLLLQSKSGSGKTLVFLIVLLEHYNRKVKGAQSLILVPTRELAIQIESILKRLAIFCHDFNTICAVGGLNVEQSPLKLENIKSIIGTPGRILNLIEKKVFCTAHIRLLILDEADKMIYPTYREDLRKIMMRLPLNKQIIASSATLYDDLYDDLAKYMKKPIYISWEKKITTPLGVRQFLFELPQIQGEEAKNDKIMAKLKLLNAIFSRVSFKQCLIFEDENFLALTYRDLLQKDGWPCDLISTVQSQGTRLKVLQKFREFKTKILISSDLMSRGIDIENVNLIINLNVPDCKTSYLHRVGRAGRFGSEGIAITIASSEENKIKCLQVLDDLKDQINIFKCDTEKDVEVPDFWSFSTLIDDVTIEHKSEIQTNKNGVKAFSSNSESSTIENYFKCLLFDTFNKDVAKNNSNEKENIFDVFNDYQEENKSIDEIKDNACSIESHDNLNNFVTTNTNENTLFNLNGTNIDENYPQNFETKNIFEEYEVYFSKEPKLPTNSSSANTNHIKETKLDKKVDENNRNNIETSELNYIAEAISQTYFEKNSNTSNELPKSDCDAPQDSNFSMVRLLRSSSNEHLRLLVPSSSESNISLSSFTSYSSSNSLNSNSSETSDNDIEFTTINSNNLNLKWKKSKSLERSDKADDKQKCVKRKPVKNSLNFNTKNNNKRKEEQEFPHVKISYDLYENSKSETKDEQQHQKWKPAKNSLNFNTKNNNKTKDEQEYPRWIPVKNSYDLYQNSKSETKDEQQHQKWKPVKNSHSLNYITSSSEMENEQHQKSKPVKNSHINANNNNKTKDEQEYPRWVPVKNSRNFNSSNNNSLSNYEKAQRIWTGMYWNQLHQINYYVKCCSDYNPKFKQIKSVGSNKK